VASAHEGAANSQGSVAGCGEFRNGNTGDIKHCYQRKRDMVKQAHAQSVIVLSTSMQHRWEYSSMEDAATPCLLCSFSPGLGSTRPLTVTACLCDWETLHP
jgi:hypothetical protein